MAPSLRSDHHRLNLDQAEQGQVEEQTFNVEDESGAQKRSQQQFQVYKIGLKRLSCCLIRICFFQKLLQLLTKKKVFLEEYNAVYTNNVKLYR